MTVAFVGKSTQLFADGASSISPSLAVSAGNLAVLVVGCSKGDDTQTAIPAPSGWSTAESTTTVYPLTYSAQVSIFYIANTSAGTLNPTVSLAAGSYAQATILEFSGVATSTPLDVHTSNLVGSATADSTGTTGTTAVADSVAIVVGHAEDRVGNVTSLSSPAATGYTVIDTSSNNSVHIACDFSYKILSATGTQSGSWTWTTASDWAAAIAVFKGGGGGGPVEQWNYQDFPLFSDSRTRARAK